MPKTNTTKATRSKPSRSRGSTRVRLDGHAALNCQSIETGFELFDVLQKRRGHVVMNLIPVS